MRSESHHAEAIAKRSYRAFSKSVWLRKPTFSKVIAYHQRVPLRCAVVAAYLALKIPLNCTILELVNNSWIVHLEERNDGMADSTQRILGLEFLTSP